MKPISRRTGPGVVIHSDDALPVATVPVPNGTEAHAVPSTRDRVTVITADAVICLAHDGTALWRFPVEPRQKDRGGFASCAYASDERLIWIYLPYAMVGRAGNGDRWFALDATTGELRHDHCLPTAGHGAEIFAVPSDGGMLLEVGEGQDGLPMFRTDNDGNLHEYPFGDRSLVDLSPDACSFMTVAHEQEDIAFHVYPSGEVLARYDVTAFGFAASYDTWFEFTGGYLDQNIVIVVVGGVSEEEADDEWWRVFSLDLATSEVAEMSLPTNFPCSVRPLGNGTYLYTDSTETLRRS